MLFASIDLCIGLQFFPEGGTDTGIELLAWQIQSTQ